jgi:hypothetical protein
MQLRWNVLQSAVLFAIVTMLAFMILPQTSAQQPKTQTLTGVVSDTTCGATYNMKNMTPAECTRACAKQGGYALVVGNTVYRLKGHEADLEKHAGEAATVKGAVNGKTVTVESVAPSKSA